MSETTDDGEFEWTTPGRESILSTLYDATKPLKASDIRGRSDIKEGSFNHHMEPLLENNLIEVVDEVEQPGPLEPAKLYSLTVAGKDAAYQVLNRRPSELVARVDKLEQEVEGHSRRFKFVENRFERTDEQLDKLKETLDQRDAEMARIEERFEKLKEYVRRVAE